MIPSTSHCNSFDMTPLGSFQFRYISPKNICPSKRNNAHGMVGHACTPILESDSSIHRLDPLGICAAEKSVGKIDLFKTTIRHI